MKSFTKLVLESDEDDTLDNFFNMISGNVSASNKHRYMAVITNSDGDWTDDRQVLEFDEPLDIGDADLLEEVGFWVFTAVNKPGVGFVWSNVYVKDDERAISVTYDESGGKSKIPVIIYDMSDAIPEKTQAGLEVWVNQLFNDLYGVPPKPGPYRINKNNGEYEFAAKENFIYHFTHWFLGKPYMTDESLKDLYRTLQSHIGSSYQEWLNYLNNLGS